METAFHFLARDQLVHVPLFFPVQVVRVSQEAFAVFFAFAEEADVLRTVLEEERAFALHLVVVEGPDVPAPHVEVELPVSLLLVLDPAIRILYQSPL